MSATLTWETGEAPALIAARSTGAAWSGVVALEKPAGILRTTDADYPAEGRTAPLAGSFTGTLAPVREGTAMRLALTLSGDLEATGLREQVTSAPAPRWSHSPWLWSVGGVVVGLALAGAALTAPRATRGLREEWAALRGRLTAEQMADLARDAIGDEDYHEGLKWTLRARREAPASVRLLMDEGFCRFFLGDDEGALTAYAEAAGRDPSDGEADFFTAVLLVKTQRSADDAEAHFLKALEKSPALCENAYTLEQSYLSAFLVRPKVKRALEKARRRTSNDDSTGAGPKHP